MNTTTTAKALYHVNDDVAGAAGLTGFWASVCLIGGAIIIVVVVLVVGVGGSK